MVNILCWWNREARTWIVACVDENGYQLWDAQFFPNTEMLRKEFPA